MTVISTLKKSTTASLSWYEGSIKKIVLQSLAVVGLALLVACITTLACGIFVMIWEGAHNTSFKYYFKFYFMSMAKSSILYHLGVYGAYLIKYTISTSKLEDFFTVFLKKEAKHYLILLGILTLLESITYKFFSIGLFSMGSVELGAFISLLITILKIALPYLFAALFIIQVNDKKLGFHLIPVYRHAWLAGLAIAILIEGLLLFFYFFAMGIAALFNDGNSFVYAVLIIGIISFIYTGLAALLAESFQPSLKVNA